MPPVIGRAVALRGVASPQSTQQVAVLTCVADPVLRARLYDAVGGKGVLQFVPTFSALIAGLRANSLTNSLAIGVIVVPPRDATGREAAPVVREIAAGYPDIALVAHCRAGVEHSADIRGLAVAGVHEFLFDGDDSRLALRSVLESARQGCAAERVMAHLTRVLPEKVHPLVDACLARPAAVRTVEHLADVTGLHRKTLYNQCIQAGSPGPAELVVWCRLALVAYLLERTARTVESIADELEFASPTALRNTIKRYTGLRATQMRVPGGLDGVISALTVRVGKSPLGLHMV